MSKSPEAAKFDADLEALTRQMEPYAKSAFLVMPRHLQADIVMYFLDNPTKFTLVTDDLIQAWLEWNGIIGYTNDLKLLFRHTANHVSVSDNGI